MSVMVIRLQYVHRACTHTNVCCRWWCCFILLCDDWHDRSRACVCVWASLFRCYFIYLHFTILIIIYCSFNAYNAPNGIPSIFFTKCFRETEANRMSSRENWIFWRNSKMCVAQSTTTDNSHTHDSSSPLTQRHRKRAQHNTQFGITHIISVRLSVSLSPSPSFRIGHRKPAHSGFRAYFHIVSFHLNFINQFDSSIFGQKERMLNIVHIGLDHVRALLTMFWYNNIYIPSAAQWFLIFVFFYFIVVVFFFFYVHMHNSLFESKCSMDT